jgi:hypothetical protein
MALGAEILVASVDGVARHVEELNRVEIVFADVTGQESRR